MNTTITLEIESFSSEETEKLGEALGKLLKGGDVIDLSSDLGGGKTTLTRGIARGMGSKSHVSSPTFKICNVYDAGRLKIYHFDFYRLSDPGLIKYEIQEVIDDPYAVIVIEWSEVLSGLLPDRAVLVNISSIGEFKRLIKIEFEENKNGHLIKLKNKM
jgi:tRNA threonylcarbamoyladenosine biosynthesis protein TsaE